LFFFCGNELDLNDVKLMLSISAHHRCSGTEHFLHMSVNAHDKFDRESAQNLRLLHIATPLHFPHAIHILEHAISPRDGNRLALPAFPTLSHLS
jgi:hypothetical protein